MPGEEYENVGACSFEDAMTIDDILLGSAARNPRIKPTMVVDWPTTTGYLRDRATGELVPYERYPAGPITKVKMGPAPVRVKIYVGLGMLAIDRDITTSCVCRTGFCERHCYNRALMRVRPQIKQTGPIDEVFWNALDGDWLYAILHSDPFRGFADRMEKTPAFLRARMRLATRGEAFARPSDVLKVADIVRKNPATTFWVTTRCWIRNNIADLIEKHVLKLPNARVLASLDPSYSEKNFDRAMSLGWNTIFFGDDEFTEGRFLCPKTWEKKVGYCRICKNGCFKNGPVDVHLAIHGTRVAEEEIRAFRERYRP